MESVRLEKPQKIVIERLIEKSNMDLSELLIETIKSKELVIDDLSYNLAFYVIQTHVDKMEGGQLMTK